MLTIRFRSCQCGPAWPGEEESERPSTTTRHFAERRGCSERTVPRSVDTGRRGRRRHQPCPRSTRPSATSSAYSSPRCSITNRVCRSVALRSRPAQDRRGRRSWTPRPHREGPRVQPGCLMINMPLELSQAAAYGGIAQRAVETIERNLRMAVEAGKAAGEIATQVDAKQITGALLSLLLEERREAKIAAAAGQSAEIAVDTARRIAHGTNGTAHGDDHLAREALARARARAAATPDPRVSSRGLSARRQPGRPCAQRVNSGPSLTPGRLPYGCLPLDESVRLRPSLVRPGGGE